jgi:DNA-binding XRE family transcriptional regulator
MKGGHNMNNILEGLGTTEKVKALMAVRGINQATLATTIGVSPGTIGNRFEKNDWEVSELKTIAAAYGVEVTDLV